MITFTDGWREEQIHLETMELLNLKKQEAIINIMKPTIKQDGNQWCVISGEMPESYIAGFGDTVHDAVSDFVKNYYAEKITIVK